jgi:hypothetical protein
MHMSKALKQSSLDSFNCDRKNHAERIMRQIKEGGAEYVDFRFTDMQGVWHHLSLHKSAVDVDSLCQGYMFDGSSINGWRPIHDSDMLLLPDATNAVCDQLTEHPTLIVFCSVVDPSSGAQYTRDPRSVAICLKLALRTPSTPLTGPKALIQILPLSTSPIATAGILVIAHCLAKATFQYLPWIPPMIYAPK